MLAPRLLPIDQPMGIELDQLLNQLTNDYGGLKSIKSICLQTSIADCDHELTHIGFISAFCVCAIGRLLVNFIDVSDLFVNFQISNSN